jgi:serine phosphatase RsbU (regulator of sigma subunit)
VISFLLYNNYKQKKIIKQFSENLEEKNMKLNTSLTEISVQKKIIEEASLQITDSINYASKLQTSLLPKLNEIKANFSDFFLLNLPKNIVSGDISFYKSTNLFDYIACIDCTGHGVPGAMISFIASEELYHLSETESSPAEILKKLNKRINKLFNNESEIGSEGMDLMLLKISKEKKCLTYAGAKSKAILIQNNTLTELITSKTSIGQRKQLDDNTFEEYELNYNQGDRLILFSDGYADQFCEEKKKRFGYKNFIEIIEENKTKNFETLKSALYDAHIKEKGNNKQTDDIQIIGISF